MLEASEDRTSSVLQLAVDGMDSGFDGAGAVQDALFILAGMVEAAALDHHSGAVAVAGALLHLPHMSLQWQQLPLLVLAPQHLRMA